MYTVQRDGVRDCTPVGRHPGQEAAHRLGIAALGLAGGVGAPGAAHIVQVIQCDVDADGGAGLGTQLPGEIARFGHGRPLAAPQEAERFHFVAAGEVSTLCRVEIDAGVEQEDRHILRAVAEDLQVDVGVLAGGAVEHCAGQVRVVDLEAFHQDQRDTAQQRQHARLGIRLEQRLVFADFGFDLFVIRKPLAHRARLRAEHLACGLALGSGVVCTVLRDHAGGNGGDFLPHADGVEGGAF